MRAVLRGTRGSLGRAGDHTVRYGGDTSAIELTGSRGSVLVLDAGSGASRVVVPPDTVRVDVLLTHLHMDHIQGLGFFGPLFDPDIETHIWGPVSTTMTLHQRLSRYLSPPLFPVRLRDLPTTLVHDVHPGSFEVGEFTIRADLVCHPGPTMGFRLEDGGTSLTYIPDHEPALGNRSFPGDPAWTSGFGLAEAADVLIHDTQYTDDEYGSRIGWGHSTIRHAIDFAEMAGVGRLVTFHHDPNHTDEWLDRRAEKAVAEIRPRVKVIAGLADVEIEV